MNNLYISLFSFAITIIAVINLILAIHSDEQRIENGFTAAWALALAVRSTVLVAIGELVIINIITISLALIFSFIAFAFTPNGYMKMLRLTIMALTLGLLLSAIFQI